MVFLESCVTFTLVVGLDIVRGGVAENIGVRL